VAGDPDCLSGEGEAEFMFQAFMDVTPIAAIFYLLSFVIALSIIVFVHEYGHFIVGRWCGVKVEVFSIGFGRELFGFTDSKGTRWKFCLWPLGGYVRFEGDSNAASKPNFDSERIHSPTSFHGKPIHQRAAVVVAGPLANFILAIAIFWGSFAFIGEHYYEPVVDDIRAGSAAEKAGIKTGDRIVSIGGQPMSSFEDIRRAVWLHPGEQLDISLRRNGSDIGLKVIPDTVEEPDSFGGKMKLGILGIVNVVKPGEPLNQTYSPLAALSRSIEQTQYVVVTTFKFLGKIILGDQSIKQIGGAASIAKGAGDAAKGGVLPFALFLGLLSVSIGLINLFPVPMLDGGHLFFYAIEAVRGKPLGPNAQEWGYRIGLSFVAMLMLVGLFNDSGRFINHFFGT
jgi:regulator of sigma E protease